MDSGVGRARDDCGGHRKGGPVVSDPVAPGRGGLDPSLGLSGRRRSLSRGTSSADPGLYKERGPLLKWAERISGRPLSPDTSTAEVVRNARRTSIVSGLGLRARFALTGRFGQSTLPAKWRCADTVIKQFVLPGLSTYATVYLFIAPSQADPTAVDAPDTYRPTGPRASRGRPSPWERGPRARWHRAPRVLS